MSKRYGIYFIPEEGSELEAFGRRWLGRSSRGLGLPSPGSLTGVHPDKVLKIVREPFHYGFHATLKPPFRLREGHTAEELYECVESFASEQSPIEIASLQLCRLGHFLALVPFDPLPKLDRLASACVQELDLFRAPPTDAELKRRRSARLTERQEHLLAAWGYPYVMEEYRFHFTLTGRIEDGQEMSHVRESLESLTRPVCNTPFRIDAITVVEQESIDSPFFATRSFPLLAATAM